MLSMSHIVALELADGITWGIIAENNPATVVVSRCAEAMHLGRDDHPNRQLLISVKENKFLWTTLPTLDDRVVLCYVHPAYNADMLAIQLMRVALVISLDAERRGGLLLHGALAERDGYGVILAGPGGVGKTMASQRLRPPWRALCDDMTLVVRGAEGGYWAHPWPTWSRFMFGKPGGSWDVQHAVPLKGIFFLSQAQEDSLDTIGMGQACSQLVELSEQTSGALLSNIRGDEMRKFRMRRFENICALQGAVPSYHLSLSLGGPFWRKIEKTIAPEAEGVW